MFWQNRIFFFFLFIIFSAINYGQDLSPEFKNWYIGSINLKFTSKSSVKVSQLASFDQPKHQFGFSQTSLILNQKINKKFTLLGGYAYSLIKGKNQNTTYSRIAIGLSHTFRIDKFRIKNETQIQHHFPGLQKFKSRIVLTNKISYRNKNWPIGLSPYIKNQIQYYHGGTEITYWLDEEEEIIESIEQAPNGWHRYRFTAGLRTKPLKKLSANFFYINQIEFNTGWSPYTELNVYNKSKTRKKRPFNNYSLIGISLTLTFKTY